MPADILSEACSLFPFALVIAAVGCAVMLICAPSPGRSRNIVAALLSTLAVSYLPASVASLCSIPYLPDSFILNPIVIVVSNIMVAITVLYPIEVIRPGWLNIRRTASIFAPALIAATLYLIISATLPAGTTHLSSFSAIPSSAGQFNVWGRFILLLVDIGYLAYILIFVRKYKKPYMEWCENNFSSFEGLSITWLPLFIFWLILLAVAFSASLLTASAAIQCLFYAILIAAIFCLTFKSLFQANAYPADFFRDGLDEGNARHLSAVKEQKRLGVYPLPPQPKEQTFDENLHRKAHEIKEWFETEKPYRRSGFQLSDVSERIPVCRTYLSRIFNEGLGDSFSHVIRDYRLRDAEQMLIEMPETSAADISEMCGFSNPAAFNRSFAQAHNGITPGKFRKSHIKNSLE